MKGQNAEAVLLNGYQEMAEDERGEEEAAEWVGALLADAIEDVPASARTSGT
jgi:hypothetical protein